MSRDWPSRQFGYVSNRFLTKPYSKIANNQELTPEAEIVNVRFTKSVIASKAAFTYEEAQLRKDDGYAISFRHFEFRSGADRYRLA